MGGSAPTTPYTINHEGKGPAWANSLFEDTSEELFNLCEKYSKERYENYKNLANQN